MTTPNEPKHLTKTDKAVIGTVIGLGVAGKLIKPLLILPLLMLGLGVGTAAAETNRALKGHD